MSTTSTHAAADNRPAVTCTGIDHVVVYVRDVARSVAFYAGVLGMEVKSQGTDYAFLRCGGQLLGLFAADGNEDVGKGEELSHLAFTVATGTVSEIKSVLAARGVSSGGRRGDPDCIYFDDPDGHHLQIVPLGE